MKALKEKRISLRSLWRMGLVVLSVFALAFVFVACGDSETGDNGTPGGPIVVTGPNPTSASVLEAPLEGRGGARVLEGQKVNLAGIVLNVRYSDNTSKTITASENMTVKPSIYDARYTDYEVTYTEPGKRPVTVTISFTNIRRILDLDITGRLVTQEYLIDEMPDLKGIVVWGVYSDSVNPPLSTAIPSWPNYLEGWANNFDYYSDEIPIDLSNPEYRWAWVHNAIPGTGQFINDNPGVLLSIGSYGKILSKVQGAGSSPPPVGTLSPEGDGYQGWDDLTGKRVPISKLYQVREIAVTGDVSVFYDDPTLISAVRNEAELQARMEKWIDLYRDATVNITYTNGDSRPYKLYDLLSMDYAYADSYTNLGWGGTWANLELFPISRAGFMIDVTKDNKTIVTAAEGTTVVKNFNWLDAKNGLDTYSETLKDGSTGLIIGDGGWAQWAQLGVGQNRLGFWWRGVRSDPVVVKVYNRPTSMQVSQKGNEPFTPVRMVGADMVYRRPEGMAEYFNKVNIAVTYLRQGGTDDDRKTRDDLLGDMAKGECREFVIGTEGGTTYYVAPSAVAPDPFEDLKRPSLYSLNVFNFMDKYAGSGTIPKWRYDFDAIKAIQVVENPSITDREVADLSMLTRTASETYQTKGGAGTRGRIYYTGWAGNPEATRTVNSQGIPMVAPFNYVYNPEDAYN
ncbi:MAG: hypothetical protein LBQ94_08450 [Treponema sp.]|jgi:hypothetical protein|nr:hypothetical protein [Treponema sp.]